MPTYRVTFTNDRTEDFDGDRVSVESGDQLVIYRGVIVIGRPREIVVKRLRGADVLAVDEV